MVQRDVGLFVIAAKWINAIVSQILLVLGKVNFVGNTGGNDRANTILLAKIDEDSDIETLSDALQMIVLSLFCEPFLVDALQCAVTSGK